MTLVVEVNNIRGLLRFVFPRRMYPPHKRVEKEWRFMQNTKQDLRSNNNQTDGISISGVKTNNVLVKEEMLI